MGRRDQSFIFDLRASLMRNGCTADDLRAVISELDSALSAVPSSVELRHVELAVLLQTHLSAALADALNSVEGVPLPESLGGSDHPPKK